VRRCPSCQGENTDDAEFCTYCGAGLAVRRCPDCQGENDAEAGFCTFCGASLTDVVATKVAPVRASMVQTQPQEYVARCPRCGSTQIHVVTESQTQGVSVGKGCCGAALMGPLGLLCGWLGSGKSKSTAVRLCANCGAKF
jgi:hypothetical protein